MEEEMEGITSIEMFESMMFSRKLMPHIFYLTLNNFLPSQI
jgi:hypothetical protein